MLDAELEELAFAKERNFNKNTEFISWIT